jgi:hypothetical protein
MKLRLVLRYILRLTYLNHGLEEQQNVYNMFIRKHGKTARQMLRHRCEDDIVNDFTNVFNLYAALPPALDRRLLIGSVTAGNKTRPSEWPLIHSTTWQSRPNWLIVTTNNRISNYPQAAVTLNVAMTMGHKVLNNCSTELNKMCNFPCD